MGFGDWIFRGVIYGTKKKKSSFFAPKLAHEWAQTVGAKNRMKTSSFLYS
jgi:hypothetical protein